MAHHFRPRGFSSICYFRTRTVSRITVAATVYPSTMALCIRSTVLLCLWCSSLNLPFVHHPNLIVCVRVCVCSCDIPEVLAKVLATTFV
eukprot:7319152-Pyramimonas_sp.AAC.1